MFWSTGDEVTAVTDAEGGEERHVENELDHTADEAGTTFLLREEAALKTRHGGWIDFAQRRGCSRCNGQN